MCSAAETCQCFKTKTGWFFRSNVVTVLKLRFRHGTVKDSHCIITLRVSWSDSVMVFSGYHLFYFKKKKVKYT